MLLEALNPFLAFVQGDLVPFLVVPREALWLRTFQAFIVEQPTLIVGNPDVSLSFVNPLYWYVQAMGIAGYCRSTVTGCGKRVGLGIRFSVLPRTLLFNQAVAGFA